MLKWNVQSVGTLAWFTYTIYVHLTCSIDMYIRICVRRILLNFPQANNDKQMRKKSNFYDDGAVGEKTKSSIIIQIAKTVLWYFVNLCMSSMCKMGSHFNSYSHFFLSSVFHSPFVWYQPSKIMNFEWRMEELNVHEMECLKNEHFQIEKNCELWVTRQCVCRNKILRLCISWFIIAINDGRRMEIHIVRT